MPILIFTLITFLTTCVYTTIITQEGTLFAQVSTILSESSKQHCPNALTTWYNDSIL